MLVLLLWPVPLLGLLHAESSAVIAAAAYFAAGLSSILLFRRGHALVRVYVWQIGALLIPLLLLTVTVLWRPNCAYADGLLFFALFPVPTVALSVGFAYALVSWNVRRASGWIVGVGLALCILGPIYDVGFHPQFYTYNHVFGGILGPVYDEELAVRSGLFIFRGLTLFWAAFFVLLGRMAAGRTVTDRLADRRQRLAASALVLTFVAILLTYLSAVELGINTTTGSLKGALPGRRVTAHFEISYDPEMVSESELQLFEDEHEFRYQELARMLGVDVQDRIQSFIYPDADVKANLTGARYTNVAPVWLSDPQLHVLASEFASVFPHELAHVFSREFGLPLLKASLAVGLVEGLAVALEPPSGLPTPHEQVSAALLSRTDDGAAAEEGARDLAAVVASHLSPVGFWTGRGAVSYTTMGSFVRYLLDAYGAGPMKEVYATGNFRRVYGRPLASLTSEWTASLLSLPSVATSSGPLAAARFAVPSLFEKRCPHHLPAYRADYRRATIALVRGDSVGALQAAGESLEREPRYLPSLDLWAKLMLTRGMEDTVRARIEPLSSGGMSAALYVRLGDARALNGDSTEARQAYERALDRLPSYAHEDASRVHLRRAAAGRPEILRTLLGMSVEPSETDPVARIARSFHYAFLEQYEQAAEVLRTTPAALIDSRLEPGAVEALRRRRLVWLAQLNYRAGAHSTAATYAESASEAYRLNGAFNEASQLDDFRRMMRWLASNTGSIE